MTEEQPSVENAERAENVESKVQEEHPEVRVLHEEKVRIRSLAQIFVLEVKEEDGLNGHAKNGHAKDARKHVKSLGRRLGNWRLGDHVLRALHSCTV